MSDTMRQLPFGALMDRILDEYDRTGSVFGITRLYRYPGGDRPEIFGEKPELPFGPAAGPHTQLAQNLVAAYVSGARFFELKTVQVLDGFDLPVSKPCIFAPDECYNVEWSTELYVPQALDEYIKGWFAIKLLSRELGLGGADGFVFNMSVGYDLDGIKTAKIDSFIDSLKDAENTETWMTCRQWALENLRRFKHIDVAYIDRISPRISKSITLSTLHGCPPDEIERIATYLLTEKKLHTFVKCNPTLLGYEYARRTLDSLGFDYLAFDDHHFKADLQFSDAVPMFSRLSALADSLSLSFGVKLTNTFPVKITAGELPGGEMYMSGRSLFPLSIEVANRLSQAFDGGLRISYSGGADIHNISDIIGAGIWPVTLATTLLKPGGYQRLNQLACELAVHGCKPFAGVDLDKLQALTDKAGTDPLYRKPARLPPVRKIKPPVPLLDCFTAPCRDGCPLGQDIPAYLRFAGEGRYLDALKVITARNPLPFITGTICPHNCMDKCTRSFYESSVNILAVKLEAAEKAYDRLLCDNKKAPKTGGKIAVIGGGPAGLSAAYFLAIAGQSVTLFEKSSALGGVVRRVIPEFRISDAAIDKDVAFIRSSGVEVRLNSEVRSFEELRSEAFSQIVLAIGAWSPGKLDPEVCGAIDALRFLEQIKNDPNAMHAGENVVVIGGGNTAMDTARAAKRVAGVKNVSIIYRRTMRYMPADGGELDLALREGIEFYELLAPAGLHDGVLTCAQMQLGAPDVSGRRSPVPTGQTRDIPADLVISAVGNTVESEYLRRLGIPADPRGKAIVDSDTLETKLPGVYIIGDAANGPATVAQAIADAIKCASAITGENTERYTGENVNPDIRPAMDKKGVLYKDHTQVHESKRCLECATVCECCVDVCPNRANIALYVDGRPQIVHIDSMCNECGNCETFCPYSSAPYLDKFTFFTCAEDFENSKNAGFLRQSDGSVVIRLDGKTSVYSSDTGLPTGIWTLIKVFTEENRSVSEA